MSNEPNTTLVAGKTYTLKEPEWESKKDEEGFSRYWWYSCFGSCGIDETEEHCYRAHYCFDEYYDEDSRVFPTVEAAKQWLETIVFGRLEKHLKEVQR